MRHHHFGRCGRSNAGPVGGILAAGFGIFWTVMAFSITAGSPFPLMHVVFPLFGVIFVIASLSGIASGGQNATRNDPNVRRGAFGNSTAAARYCARCGAAQAPADQFCSRCGTRARA